MQYQKVRNWIGGLLACLPALAMAADWADIGHVHDLALTDGGQVYVLAHEGVYQLQEGRPELHARGHFTSVAVAGGAVSLAGFDAGNEPAAFSRVDVEQGGAPSPAQGLENGHLLAVVADPAGGLYGVARSRLYYQTEPGEAWRERGPLPEKTIDMAAAAEGRLYAATAGGFMISEDGGRSWSAGTRFKTPATAVALEAGELRLFQHQVGLMKSPVDSLRWEVASNDFGQQVPVRMVADGEGRLYASTNRGYLFMSANGGDRWRRIDRIYPDEQPSAAAKRGKVVYDQYCVSCHGIDGVGEAPTQGERVDGLAPSLDETMHAWHHTDENLRTVIRDGTGGRMPGWGESLSDAQVDDLLAYMKSLWDDTALRCQGPAHMDRECLQQ